GSGRQRKFKITNYSSGFSVLEENKWSSKNGPPLNQSQRPAWRVHREPIDLAGAFCLSRAVHSLGSRTRPCHSAVSSPDAESARDFLFAAHLVAGRDSHDFSGRTWVDNLEMEGRPSLVAQSALGSHSRLVDCARLVRAPESLRVDVQSSSQQFLCQSCRRCFC